MGLFSVGADMDLETEEGVTPLMAAVHEENYTCIKALLELGANVNKLNHNTDWAALHLASNLGNIDLVTLLMENGADMELSATGD